MLVFLSFITFQLIRLNYFKLRDHVPNCLQKIAKGVIYFLAFVAILMNTVPMVFVLFSWIESQVVVFNVSYLFNVENISSTYDKIPPIALRDMSNKQVHSLVLWKALEYSLNWSFYSSHYRVVYRLSCLFLRSYALTSIHIHEKRPGPNQIAACISHGLARRIQNSDTDATSNT